jgi:cytochrome P450
VTTTDPSAPVEFDPFSDEYFNDPSEVYRRLRDEAPVFHSERYGFYALSRFDDVVTAHKQWQSFSSAHGVDLSTLSKDPEQIRSFRSIIMMDPPEHDRLRSLVSRVFTPRAMTALEPMVREVVLEYLDPLSDRDSFDAVAEFSALFPVEIICRMLGVPKADRQQIRHWLDISLHREPGSMEPTAEGIQAGYESGAYFYGLVMDKRAHPADDMLSDLTMVEVERDNGEMTRLDDAEIAGFASLLGGAGAETVTKLVGNAVVLFARHQAEWDKVVSDPGKIPSAVEEILRYLPPSQYQGRFSVRDHTFDGGTIPAGYPVLLVTGAATRDPRAFDRPDDFDITRPPKLAISLGHGVHTCLGAALARTESRIALEEMAKRWPSFSIDADGLRRVQMSNVAGYSNVPMIAG